MCNASLISRILEIHLTMLVLVNLLKVVLKSRLAVSTNKLLVAL